MTKKTSICLMLIISGLVIFNFFKAGEVNADSLTYDEPGTYTYTVPADINTITVETWGAGGAGGGSSHYGSRRSGKGGAGGGGGAYARSELNVEAIDTLYIIVGTEGVGVYREDGTDGSPSFVGLDTDRASALVLATPGLGGGSNTSAGMREGGRGGSIADSIGDFKIPGEDGRSGGGCCNACSGAGGKGAEGGVGGAAICGICSDGNSGNRPGGGGSGSLTTGRARLLDDPCLLGTGGDGASGKVIITEITPEVTYELNIDSTSGGEVTVPGEGTFIIAGGRVVSLEAAADSANIFINWTGDVDTIGNTGSAITNITMNNNYSITAVFDCPLPFEPTLVSPGDFTTEVAPYDPNFQWFNPGSGASYEIQLLTDSSLTDSNFIGGFASTSVGAGTTQVDWWGSDPLSNGIYYWRVFAINICGTAESETFTFTVEAPVTCWEPTPNFASGCAMLLHYDTNNDGIISTDELLAAVNDYNAGNLTMAEIYFIIDAWEEDEINDLCPGCYFVPPPVAEMECELLDCRGPGCVCDNAFFSDWEIFHNPRIEYNVNNISPSPDIDRSVWSIINYQVPRYTCPPDDGGNPLCHLGAVSFLSIGNYNIELEVRNIHNATDTFSHPIRVKRDTVADFECSLTGVDPDWHNCAGFAVEEGQVVYFKGEEGIALSRSSWHTGLPAPAIETWQWEKGVTVGGIFVPDGPPFGDSSTASTTLTVDTKEILLTIRDNHPGGGRTAQGEKTLNVRLPLPDYREVRPRSQLDNFFARITGMFR